MGGPPLPGGVCSALICRYTRPSRGCSLAWVHDDLSDRPNCEGQLLLSTVTVTVLVVCVPGRPLLQPTR